MKRQIKKQFQCINKHYFRVEVIEPDFLLQIHGSKQFVFSDLRILHRLSFILPFRL